MYNWKDARNYRRFRDENGNVIANIIYVDGEEVAVSDEVYEAYASMDRRERYLEERDNDDKPLSVDALLEEGYSEAALCSAENLEDMIADKLLKRAGIRAAGWTGGRPCRINQKPHGLVQRCFWTIRCTGRRGSFCLPSLPGSAQTGSVWRYVSRRSGSNF